MASPVPVSKPAVAVGIFNQIPGECQWPTLSGIRECAFPFFDMTPVDEGLYGKDVQIVTIPAGTILYHATKIFPGKPLWFLKGFQIQTVLPKLGLLGSISESYVRSASSKPLPTSVKGSWFASTKEHAQNIDHTHLLQVRVKTDLTLMYIQNIKTTYLAEKGFNLIRSAPFMKNYTVLKDKYKIDGYVGCNECEIFIRDTSFEKLDIPVVLEEHGLKYLGGRRNRKTRKNRTRKRHRVD